MKKPVLVIMAAGMGSRYGGLKQMDPVGSHDQVILDYSIYDARRAGFETVVIVIKDEIEADFKERVGRRIQRHMDVHYAFQRMDALPEGYGIPAGRVKPWGTAQAALAARPFVDGPFAIINSDDFYGPEAFRAIYEHLCAHPEGTDYAMAAYLLENTVTDHGHVARGVCKVGEDGRLTAITERTRIEKGPPLRFTEDEGRTWTELPGDTRVSMNFWGFTRTLLDQAQEHFPRFLDRAMAKDPLKAEYLLPTLVGELVDEGQATVWALPSGDKWYGVTYREDKPAVAAAIARMTAEGLYPDALWL